MLSQIGTTAIPLVTSKGAMSRVVTQDYMDKQFKDNGAPMLETNERGQCRDFLINQENQLNSYGWVDEKAGVAHIPIERAMELTVQRGLPVCPQGLHGRKHNDGKQSARPEAGSTEAVETFQGLSPRNRSGRTAGKGKSSA